MVSYSSDLKRAKPLWFKCVASNVSRLDFASVYRVKCIAPFGHYICISRQMYRVLWALRLYIASNVSRPLGIASVYRVK